MLSDVMRLIPKKVFFVQSLLSKSQKARSLFSIVVIIAILAPFYLFWVPHFWRTQDEKNYFWLMESVTDEHSLQIEFPDSADLDFIWGMPKVKSDKAIIIKYPIGQSLILSAAKLAGGYRLVFLAVPLIVLLSIVVLFYLTISITHKLRIAVIASLLLGFAPSWIIHSRSILSDVPAGATMLLGTYFVYRTLQHNINAYWLAAGISVAAGILIRYPNILFFGPLLLFLLLNTHVPRTRSGWTALFAPSALIITAICVYNYLLFGSIFTIGYHAAGEKGFSLSALPSNLANYLVLTLVAIPGGSLCAFYFVVVRKRMLPYTRTAIMWASILIFIIFYSSWNNLNQLTYKPEDLLVFGGRLILPIFPFLAFFTACGMELWSSRVKYRTTVVLGVLFIFAGLSIFCSAQVGEKIRAYATVNEFINKRVQPGSLVLLKLHWYKVIWPHFGPHRYMALKVRNSPRILEEIQIQILQEKPIVVVWDPYVRLGIKAKKPNWQYLPFYKIFEKNGLRIIRGEELKEPFELILLLIEPAVSRMGVS
ncbi:MAG: glycosyltransferase family 39 protein [Deltaproteobacteria bacterium]|nr:glycosyltransferase family 39 protein [Deltaproteobacteria bacterium]